jgi:flavin reductase (DIM6/NTAB) family NADH-FMN oxidoreductase RutF
VTGCSGGSGVMAEVADLFRRLTTGVYVIGVAEGERRNGFTAAWLTQVSFDPLLLALSINPEHASYPLLVGGGWFVVNVLRRDQLYLAEAFGTRSGRDQDKLADIAWRAAGSGAPILSDALAWLECRIHQRVPAGDHELILGRPVAGELVSPEATPLHYQDTGELDGSRELYPSSLG